MPSYLTFNSTYISLHSFHHFSEGNTGPVDGIDYFGTVTAEFTKLKKRPEVGRWIQATTTTIARYLFTERDDVRMANNGFMLKYVTDSGEDATHFVSFDSPALADEEFRPFMDICYIPCKAEFLSKFLQFRLDKIVLISSTFIETRTFDPVLRYQLLNLKFYNFLTFSLPSRETNALYGRTVGLLRPQC